MKKYKAIYKDKFGTENSEFQSNGSELKIKLRGIEFKGDCFECLEGEIDKEKFEYTEFEGQEGIGDLTNCKFKVEIPIKLIKDEQEITATIQANIQIEQGDDSVNLELESNQYSVSCSKRHGFVEDALIEIQNQLPENVKIKT